MMCSDELHAALVLSTKSHARLGSVDASNALAMPGVVDFVSHRDVPGSNKSGPNPVKDEEIFATETVFIHSTLHHSAQST